MPTTTQGQLQESASEVQILTHPAYHEAASESAISLSQKVSHVLQTTLEIEQLVRLFAQEVVQFVAYSGIHYVNSDLNIDVSVGEVARHRCSYRLVIEEEELGELVYSRRTHFTQNEIQTLEDLLCGLIYPLRNAIQYQRAMSSALSDALTGIGNRAALDVCVSREIELAKRHDTTLSLMMLDVDEFKTINDTHGHKVGDDIIKLFVEVLKDSVRGSDICFRYGGDEFVIVLSRTEPEGAKIIAERIRKKIAEGDFDCDGERLTLTTSVGVTSLHTADNLDSFLHRADKALYEAKAKGRNQVCIAM